MSTLKFHEYQHLVENSVIDAAQYLTKILASGAKPEVNVKKDASLVLSFDLECERLINERLGSVLPVLAEENESSHELFLTESTYFLVDPLDGTTSCSRFLNSQGGQVGYGPLVGCVVDNKLSIASFYNAPMKTLYTAVHGEGLYAVALPEPGVTKVPNLKDRTKITAKKCEKLVDAGVLFLVGKGGETSIVQFLKDRDAIQNLYRFGGFANDCTRLSLGLEQLTIQFSVKAWDYTAALFAHEAGLEVMVDPFGKKVSFEDWKVSAENPVIIVNAGIKEELFRVLSEFKKS